jgi:hypothetical protein
VARTKKIIYTVHSLNQGSESIEKLTSKAVYSTKNMERGM